MGGQGRGTVRSVAGGHPPLWQGASIDRLGAGTHAGSLRQALHHRLAVGRTPLGPAHAPLAALCASQGGGGLFRRKAGLGTAQLVCRSGSGRGGGRPLQLSAPRLVGRGAARTSGRARGGGADRPDLFREIHAERAGCGSGPELDRGRQCRPRRGQPDLYADAERQGRDRGRCDRGTGGAGRVLHRHRHRLCHA